MGHNYLTQFENPSSEFRGAPFWSWNCKLDKEELLTQLEYFKEMGMGGVTIHCRTGLATEYMGTEFMDIVKACVQKAKAMDMKICLYDEDRWPSGFAGGEVTKEERFRSRYLVFTPFSNESREIKRSIDSVGSTAGEKAKGNGKLLGRYDITLENGLLLGYRKLKDEEEGKNVWYAYLEISENSPWYNNQSYVNTLDKKAIERFIEITHEKYYDVVGEEFGKSIPSIFTDEPQFVHKTTLGKAEDKRDIIIPYTDDFEETFNNQYKESFLDQLPEVFWELPKGRVSLARYRYHDHLAERFASAFSDTLGKWCKEHGIKLTGHMMEEPSLGSQTQALGEAMRHYRGFQIPGIDMLCDWREYSTAKQAQSASHQMGANKVLSELYGVTNWDFDFRGHKLQGDWQAALGVTERVHHLSWVSMAGEAKRDYPASISYQSPWYKKYENIETYFGRVNTALQSGNPDVKVGVIHPIESYWLYFGPQEQTAIKREKLQQQFDQMIHWLLFGLIDFDFISESLMEDIQDMEDNNEAGFAVGKMNYDVILIPGCVTLRGTTLNRLKKFVDKGGKVIFVGDIATYVDAKESQEPLMLANNTTHIEFDQISVLNALEPYRQIDVKYGNGVRAWKYLSQLRELGEDKILFLANGRTPNNIDIPTGDTYTISIKGEYNVVKLNALDGTRQNMDATYIDGWTNVEKELFKEDSLLLYLEKREVSKVNDDSINVSSTQRKSIIETKYLNEVIGYSCSEPNVLVLDQAEYALAGESFHEREEVLRIDNILRQQLNYPRKMDALAQPWAEKDEVLEEHKLVLKYVFTSDIVLSNLQLAVEDVEQAEIEINGVKVDHTPVGYFVDKCIKTIRVPQIVKGKNEILVTLPYSRKTNLEWCYLLGEFGVEILGDKAKLVDQPTEIGFTDIVMQKFPFYAGNFTYQCQVEVEEGEYELQISKYRAPLLSIKVDGKDVGDIMFEPYTINLGNLKGQHTIEITAYGNRINAFGPLHLCNEKEVWFGPNAWRSEGAAYSYEYQFKKFGILAAPKLNRIQ